MAKQHIDGLLTDLHEKFATSETSPQQEALLQQLRGQLIDWDGPRPDGSVVTTAELLLEELEEEHPHLSHAVRELIDALGKIGI
ncbi:MAG: hypothetical protein RLZZ227_2318 [Pseudomonadota bacterium]|jgi:hypothetical protein